MTELRVPEGVQFDEKGLVPVILQHADSGEILTLAWGNAESLTRTAASGETWLYSRSRSELWHKGATSGHTQTVLTMATDCDRDAVVYSVRPAGPACHTGARSCFEGIAPTLRALSDRLEARAATSPEGSYTSRLLSSQNLRLKKLGEEATELALACAIGDDEEVAGESADLLYHMMVALLARGLSLDEVARVLRQRMA